MYKLSPYFINCIIQFFEKLTQAFYDLGGDKQSGA